jgi:hypothetical protein
MGEQPTDEQLMAWHRRFAVDASNRAWTLTEKIVLTSDEKGVGNGARKLCDGGARLRGIPQCQPWELAFAHAIMADAASASGDRQLHAEHYEKARSLGERLIDEDKDLFLATFDRIPVPQPNASS